MKILKFLHASNFQLHIPVTCWPTPILAESKVSDSINGLSNISSPNDRQIIPFSLEQTKSWLFGTAFPELPQFLIEEFLSAPWKSAERVFDIALEQNVDFLLLTGDLLQPDLTGPRGLVFLTNQFRRLQERGISVYWKLEQSIEEWLLPNFQFPENVFLFPTNETHIKKFRLADSSKNIFIVSWNTPKPDFSRYDFSKLPDEKLPPAQTIALCPNEQTFFSATGNWPNSYNENQGVIKNRKQGARTATFIKEETPANSGVPFSTVAYVGLTENSERMTLKPELSLKMQNNEVFQTFLHSPGPTLHHSPDIWEEQQITQPAGVTIVQLDLDGDLPASLQFFPTETISWYFPEKQIPENVENWENLRNWLVQELITQFSQQAKDSQNSSNLKRSLVYWHLTSEKNAQNRLLRLLFTETFQNSGFQSKDGTPNLSNLLINLRNAGKNLTTQPWTVSIIPSRDGLIPPSWSLGESMLSNFLRLVQQHLKNQNPEISSQHKNLNDFIAHSLDLKEILTEAQIKNGLAVLGELTQEEEPLFLELASILGGDSFAEMQEGGLKK